ncbi:hypothetical protein ACFOSD_12095 [Salinispirillum marinum]|uniref:DinB family protein n=2 Tax=Saccharospirillaceae TaxID=255527 RepID=A0ABV8BHX4_9GAMM
MSLLWHEAVGVMQRLENWLAHVNHTEYSGHCELLPHGQTPGRHVRHILDHYLALSVALSSGTDIDYEHRQRDPRVEVDSSYALMLLQCVQTELATHIKHGDRALILHYCTDDDNAPVTTTLARELVFLTQHSIHHFALVEMLVVIQGGAMPPGFGVNPSTRRYETSQGVEQSLCAP